GGELLEFASSVYQRRRIRQEVESRHQLEESGLPTRGRIRIVRRVDALRLCDVVGDTGEKLLGRLQWPATVVPRQIAPFEHQACVIVELRGQGDAVRRCDQYLSG